VDENLQETDNRIRDTASMCVCRPEPYTLNGSTMMWSGLAGESDLSLDAVRTEGRMMRSALVLALVLRVAAFSVKAETVTTDYVRYDDVTFGNVTESTLAMFHKQGVTFVPLKKLSVKLQERLKSSQLETQETQIEGSVGESTQAILKVTAINRLYASR
jgi:hypothetical protein